MAVHKEWSEYYLEGKKEAQSLKMEKMEEKRKEDRERLEKRLQEKGSRILEGLDVSNFLVSICLLTRPLFCRVRVSSIVCDQVLSCGVESLKWTNSKT